MIIYENGGETRSLGMRGRTDSSSESSESEYETPHSSEEEAQNLLFSYWSTLNLNLNLNLRNSYLWRAYEHGVENLSKLQAEILSNTRFRSQALVDLDLDLLQDFSDSLDLDAILLSSTTSKKGIRDPEEKYFGIEERERERKAQLQLTQESTLEEEEKKVKVKEEEAVVLSEEFWSSVMSTEVTSETGLCLPVPGTQTTVKAPINPFYHRPGLSILQKIKIGVGTVLLPIRFIFVFFFLVLAWFLAFIATRFITSEELRSRPITGWRKATRWVVANMVMRALFFCAGFYWVKKTGRQAKRSEAPILVVAPHSSYFDAFPFILLGAPSIVAKSDVANVPFFGKLVDLTQAVYVERENKDSRANTQRQITERAQSQEDWPQIYVYPEATCSNRSCLLQFKLGAFNPGVPVQPVIIKYPNHYDSLTWTFDGLSFLQSAYRSYSQFALHCELEFLPVYVPSDEEKKNPALFANNVRQVMADAIGVPVSDYTFDDGVQMSQMDTKKLKAKLTSITKLRNTLKLTSLKELTVVRTLSSSGKNAWWVSFETFEQYFGSEDIEEKRHLEELFNLFDKDDSGAIDIREYLTYSCILNHNIRVEKIIPFVFLMYGEGHRKMSEEHFTRLTQIIFEISAPDSINLFNSLRDQDQESSTIDLDKFCKRLKKRFEYLRLYGLEVSDLLKVYPPRDRELKFTHSKTKSE